MRRVLLSIILIATSPFVLDAREYVPGEVIVSFQNKTDAIFNIDESGMSSIYPDLIEYLTSSCCGKKT